MTSEKVSIIMPSHMNNEISIQNTESKYIIEMNKCKVATPYNYKKYVVDGGCYRQGLIRRMHARQTRSAWPFAPSDYPEKWNMTKIRRRARNDIFWEVGYIYRGQHQRNLKNVGYGPCFYMPRDEKNYWWCRDGDWIPLWGEATQRRAVLMTDIRTFWRNKWSSDIKKSTHQNN